MRQNAILLVFRMLGVLGLLAILGPAMSNARTPHGTQNPCDAAAAAAARFSGVPLPLLLAISRVETGRTTGGVLSPWPWAVNQAGAGSYFHTKAEAVGHVASVIADGYSNIDVGCFQINIRWHGTEFASLNAMFDPTENALYAARFLRKLYGELGSWEGATGAYHSRQSEAATAYLGKVSAVMASTQGTAASPASVQTASRDNRYPLLRAGKAGGHGSLVATASDRPAIPLLR